MTRRQPDSLGDRIEVDDDRELPIDPDIDTAEDRRHLPAGRPGGVFTRQRRRRLPPISWRVVVAVGVGGFFGGALRYGVTLWLPGSRSSLPWAILVVNTAGGFILAFLLILVLELLPPTTYLRPLLGTGFCGALTTFSSVATGADQLVARGRPGLAAGYVLISLVAGLAAASFGIVLARSIAAYTEKGRD